MPGLVMLNCATLGEALHYSLTHLTDAGSLVEFSRIFANEESIVTEFQQRFVDAETEQPVVEELLACTVSVIRSLVGSEFAPSAIHVAYAEPAHSREYSAHFRCPVHFDAGANQLSIPFRWLQARILFFDEANSRPLRTQLEQLLTAQPPQIDLLESIGRRLRTNLREGPALRSLARDLSMSERTLRRRLADSGVSFRTLLDDARRERAEELVRSGKVRMADLSEQLGFSDPRSFRRAYKRWTGDSPGTVSKSRKK